MHPVPGVADVPAQLGTGLIVVAMKSYAVSQQRYVLSVVLPSPTTSCCAARVGEAAVPSVLHVDCHS
jgi:hypothetical protein